MQEYAALCRNMQEYAPVIYKETGGDRKLYIEVSPTS